MFSFFFFLFVVVVSGGIISEGFNDDGAHLSAEKSHNATALQPSRISDSAHLVPLVNHSFASKVAFYLLYL